MNNPELVTQVQTFEKMLPSDPPANNKPLLVLYDMVQTVKSQTENYSKPDNISDIAVDVRSILKRENVEPAKWATSKGSYMRSETDSVNWLVQELNAHFSGNNPSRNDEARAKAKAKAKAKIKIKMGVLKLKQQR